MSTFCRDTHFTNPTFDFYFKVILAMTNKERMIIKSNQLVCLYCDYG